jgi:hypothetical protein
MCDEKWFSGLVPRTNAKACTELGIAKESYSAHHKKHIAKVMVHCTVGFCFNGNVEYGGDGIYTFKPQTYFNLTDHLNDISYQF